MSMAVTKGVYPVNFRKSLISIALHMITCMQPELSQIPLVSSSGQKKLGSHVELKNKR